MLGAPPPEPVPTRSWEFFPLELQPPAGRSFPPTPPITYAVQEIDFLGVATGWYPQTMSKYLSLKYLHIYKKIDTLA